MIESKPDENRLLTDEEIQLKVFEIIEAHVHQWQERPVGRFPKVMTSVNTQKMREQLVSYITELIAFIKEHNNE